MSDRLKKKKKKKKWIFFVLINFACFYVTNKYNYTIKYSVVKLYFHYVSIYIPAEAGAWISILLTPEVL